MPLIVQLDPEMMEVVQVFPSTSDAAQVLQIDTQRIERELEELGGRPLPFMINTTCLRLATNEESTAAGHVAGPNDVGPPNDAGQPNDMDAVMPQGHHHHGTGIARLVPETGEIDRIYRSIPAAAQDTGVPRDLIRVGIDNANGMPFEIHDVLFQAVP
jgi:hypothetical protein